jgi:plastocyanin
VILPHTTLTIELAMAAGLIAGMVLARLKQFRVHGWLQSSIVVANAAIIGFVMIPSFHRQALSGTSPGPRIVWAHGVAGGLTELTAIFIVLSAGPGWLPRRLRVTNYKLWMRSCLAMWLVTVGLGGYVYKQLNSDSVAAPVVSSAPTRVVIRNFAFDPPKITVPARTEIEWVDERGRHNVQADDGSFKSEILTAGATFRHRFDRPGVYRYYCQFHGDKGGQDMAGVVTVR